MNTLTIGGWRQSEASAVLKMLAAILLRPCAKRRQTFASPQFLSDHLLADIGLHR